MNTKIRICAGLAFLSAIIFATGPVNAQTTTISVPGGSKLTATEDDGTTHGHKLTSKESADILSTLDTPLKRPAATPVRKHVKPAPSATATSGK